MTDWLFRKRDLLLMLLGFGVLRADTPPDKSKSKSFGYLRLHETPAGVVTITFPAVPKEKLIELMEAFFAGHPHSETETAVLGRLPGAARITIVLQMPDPAH